MICAPPAGGRGVIMRVRLRFVIIALVVLAAVFVRVDERRVIVLVLVIVRAVLELADRSAHMVMRDVPMVVRVHLGFMLVLMFIVPDDHLLR